MPRLAYRDYVQRITLLDIIVIIIVFCTSILLFLYSIKNTQGNNMQIKITSDEGTFIYQLNRNRELIFSGPIGNTYVQILDNKVQVVDSPGRRKICVNAAPISRHGQWLACLPNRVFLRVFATHGDIDAVDAVVF